MKRNPWRRHKLLADVMAVAVATVIGAFYVLAAVALLDRIGIAPGSWSGIGVIVTAGMLLGIPAQMVGTALVLDRLLFGPGRG